MKANDFIKNLATLSGIPADDAKLVQLLSVTDKIDIDDAMAATISNSLLTMDAAKNNATLKSHFTGQALSTLDSKIEAQYAKFGLTEEEITELKSEKSSYARVEKLTDKIAELTEKKTGGNKNATEKAIQKLELEKAALIKQIADDKVKSENELAGFKSNFMLDNILAGMQYTLPDELGAAEKTKMVKSILQSKFDELGVVLNLDNDKLVPKTKENTIYYKNNQPITTEDLVKSILTDKKLIKVAAAQPTRRVIPPANNNNGNPPEIRRIPDSMDAEVERQIQAMS